MCIQKYRLIVLAMIASMICLSVEARGQSSQRGDAEVLTLEQAIAIALRGNTQIRNAEIDVNKAGAGFAATRTRRLPNFSFEVIGSQQLTPIDFTFERGVFGTFPGIGPIPAEDTKLTTPLKPTAIFVTRVTQPLTKLFTINLNLKQLELKTEIAREEARAKRQQIVRDVKRAYFALLQTESALVAAEETVRMYRELDRVTGDYLAQQVVLKTEGLDVKSRLARSEYDVSTLIDQLGIQKQQLNLLLGRDVTLDFSVAAVPAADGFESDLEAARAQALNARPEIREARLRVKQAETDRRIKKSEYIPEVSATFQHIATANFNSLIPRSYMNVGITVSWEVFDWGRKKRELAEKDMTTEQARNTVRDAERSVLIDVNDKFNKLRQARQLLDVTELGRLSAFENVRVLTNRYKVQMALLSNVLQAQAQLEQANYQKRQALVSFWTAKAEFENAIGEDK
jgi:outer membrane protein TolC